MFVNLSYCLATFNLAFILLLLPFFFLLNFLWYLASLLACFFRCFGLVILLPSLSYIRFSNPKSIPTTLFIFCLGIVMFLSSITEAYHFPEDSFFIVICFILPLIFLWHLIGIFPILDKCRSWH